MFIPVPTQASPAATELALKIVNVIREFQQSRSDVTSRDVRQALRMARLSTGPDPMRAMAIPLLVAVVVAGIAVFKLVGKGSAQPGASPVMLPVIFMVIILVLALMLVITRIRR
jgi:hypothetical protein